MDIFYVYTHTREDTGEVFYVGSGIKKRNAMKTPYGRSVAFGTKRTSFWHEVYEECGREIIVDIVREFKTPEESTKEELSLIKKYGMAHNGTGTLVNRRLQATVYTDEIRKDRSQQTSGAKHPNFGKKLSEEVIKKKSDSLSGEKHHLFGKKLPESWKNNIKKSKLGSKNPNFGKRGTGLSRKIRDIKTGETYISVSEAAESCGYKMKTLYNWLSGHRKNPTDLRFI